MRAGNAIHVASVGFLMLASGLAAGRALPGTANSRPDFVAKGQPGDWRAPQLLGVQIYGTGNDKIGSVNDVVLSRGGAVKDVVLQIGGFAGIGGKTVAVPFASIHWRDQPKVTVPPSGSDMQAGDGVTTITPSGTASSKISGPPVYDYPNHGVLEISKEQLDKAPSFAYASQQE